jgi:mRNA interferase RelE/StbE
MTETPYVLILTDNARSDLEKLDKKIARRIVGKLRHLAKNAEDVPHIALKGQWSGSFKLRIGAYRVIYKLNRERRQVIVNDIGHRSNVYDE